MPAKLDSQGIHRKKRNVDRRWLKQQLAAKDMTLVLLADALARETHRESPLDKASVTRRMHGKIPFTAQEAQALSRIFGVPLETILAKIGGVSGEPPLVGTADMNGEVNLVVVSEEPNQRITFKTGDGWNGAIATFTSKRHSSATVICGVYLAEFADHHRLIQFLGVVGTTAVISPVFGGVPKNVVCGDILSLRCVVKLELPAHE